VVVWALGRVLKEHGLALECLGACRVAAAVTRKRGRRHRGRWHVGDFALEWLGTRAHMRVTGGDTTLACDAASDSGLVVGSAQQWKQRSDTCEWRGGRLTSGPD
jgi:hypothetical protein